MKREYLIAISVAIACGNAYVATCAAEELDVSEELGAIDVFGAEASGADNKVGETVTTSQQLNKQQVQDSRDLVKYETGISVIEKGRMGASGYAMRGVEENRVNITVDGLQQAEVISSQGFNELFEGYGNFNNTRNGIEVETLKQVTIARGADSTKVGSGALGGAVIFETKDARDYLNEKDWHVGTKFGYASKNEEVVKSHTLAGRFKDFDALLVYTDRDGDEIKNWGYDTYPDVPEIGSQGRARQRTDPYTLEKKSTLFKISYNPNENNRITIMYDDFKSHSKGTDWSYTLAPLQTDRDLPELDSRHTFDSSERSNFAFAFENYDSNPFWDSAKLSVSRQKITQRARTDEYCDGEKNCKSVQNPLGLQLKNGKLTDKDGNELDLAQVSKWEGYYDWNDPTFPYLWKKGGENGDKKTLALINKATGKPLQYNEDAIEGQKINQNHYWKKTDSKTLFLDCQKVDCNSSLRFYNLANNDKFADKTRYFDVNLSDSNVQTVETTYPASYGSGSYKQKSFFVVEDIKRGASHYKKVNVKASAWDNDKKMWKVEDPEYLKKFEGTTIDPYETSKFGTITPTEPGYVSNYWKDRRLNTETKQIRIDLEKNLEFNGIDNSISYGASWSQTDKSMVNHSGFGSENIKWWAINAFDDIDDDGNPKCDGFAGLCSSKTIAETFLMPVVTKSKAFYLHNNTRFNDKFAINLSYRYDNIAHKPRFDIENDPKMPRGLVTGVFVPRGPEPKEPRWWDSTKYPGNSYSSKNDPNYLADVAKYNKDLAEWKRNPEKNMEYLANQERTFVNHSYSFGATIDPTDYLRIQAKYSTGFRVPTSDELYFTFKHPDFSVIPNFDLKAEKAKTKEIAFSLHKDRSYVTLGFFETDYDNFIELGFKGYKQFESVNKAGQVVPSGLPYRVYQNRNNSRATVRGFSVDAKLDMAELSEDLNGFSVGYKFAYQKGKTLGVDVDVNGNETQIWHAINAIDPAKHVLNIGYTDPDDTFGVDLYLTYVARKKAKDTYDAYHSADQGLFGTDEGLAAKHRSKSYSVFDVVGYYKPTKGMTIRAGIYNAFNKRYSTWSSQRSIRSFGTSNMVCKSPNAALGCNAANQGEERFDAPGRNFKIGLEYVF